MQERTLGNTQVTLPPIGLGCMGLSEFYGPPTEQSAAIELLHEAIKLYLTSLTRNHFDQTTSCIADKQTIQIAVVGVQR